MQLLYCLGSLCHLTAVWSQQKSTIFAFQQFSPTVSLCCFWKCDQCGVSISSLLGRNGSNWAFGSLVDWWWGPCIWRAHCCAGGECDGQLQVMVVEQGKEEEETGSERGGGGGELDGAGKPDWAIREWQIASAQTCWGVISPKKPEWANLCITLNHQRKES